jgi:hypothetical protein
MVNTDPDPLPFLNTLFLNNQSVFVTSGEEHQYKNFMKWARRSPQLIGFLNVIATDILSDQISFTPLEGTGGSGKNRVRRAKEFYAANNGLDLMEQTLYDLFITGIGYNWVGKVEKSQMRELSLHIAKELYGGSGVREIQLRADEIYEKAANGEVSSLAKKWRHIPSSTVTMKTNPHGIDWYMQTVGVWRKTFEPEEVIKLALIPLDGKPYPYPPMESLITEVYLLWLISQGYVSYFENGGHPDKVFILPKEIANSKNHKYMVEVLQKYKKIQNKHGNLVFTGDLKIEDLMNMETQMEHKDLALYIVGVLAMMYGIPAGRIPFLIGKAANNGDAGGLADSGYWRKISVWQSKLEAGYNYALWNPYFGVDMKFARGYMQDEVRETQNEMQKTQVAEQRLRLGLWSSMDAAKYLNIDPDGLEAAKAESLEREKSSMLLQNNNANGSTIPEPDRQAKNAKKSETQKSNISSSGDRGVKV